MNTNQFILDPALCYPLNRKVTNLPFIIWLRQDPNEEDSGPLYRNGISILVNHNNDLIEEAVKITLLVFNEEQPLELYKFINNNMATIFGYWNYKISSCELISKIIPN